MAQRIEWPSATIPPGTAQASPVAIPLQFPEGIIDRVDILIPPGASGLMGFFLSQSGTQLIPRTAGQFIVADDKYLSFPVEDHPTGSKWACVGYNTDVYPHTITFGFLVRELASELPMFPAPLAFG